MALLYPHQRIKTVDPAKDHQLNLLKNMAPSYEEGDHRLIQTEDGRIIRLHLVYDLFDNEINPRQDAGNLGILCLKKEINRTTCREDSTLTAEVYDEVRKHINDPDWIIMPLEMFAGYHDVWKCVWRPLNDFPDTYEKFTEENPEINGILYTNKAYCEGKVEWDRQAVILELQHELEVWNEYLRGDVMGYELDEWTPATYNPQEQPDIDNDDDWNLNIAACWRFYWPSHAELMVEHISNDLNCKNWKAYEHTPEAFAKACAHLKASQFDCPVCHTQNSIKGYINLYHDYHGVCENCHALLEVHLPPNPPEES